MTAPAHFNVIHARQLVTVNGPDRTRRGAEMRDLGITSDGAMEVLDGAIVWTGPTDAIPNKGLPELDASHQVLLPGFVDSHTHAVYVRSRAAEFEWRIEGTPYMEILRRGGGILSSVAAVRGAAVLEVRHARRFFEYGTTTIEVKSGYGLDLANEIRILEAARRAPIETVRTYLGAHAVPPEFDGDRPGFVSGVTKDVEIIAARRLAEFCDVFVEPGAFTPDDARQICARATSLGLDIKLHADEFESSGGAELAVELDAVSADHLGAVSDTGIAALARSSVVATLLPSTLFMLGHTRYAPARRLIEAGAGVALATDFNPGTSPTVNMQFVMSLACTQMRMTPAEAIVAATINGAAAIRRASTLGSLAAGKKADFALFAVEDYRDIAYHAAVNFCTRTYKAGLPVWISS